MLGKLLKYELKASGRIFIPLYIAILIVAVFNGIFMNTSGTGNRNTSINKSFYGIRSFNYCSYNSKV